MTERKYDLDDRLLEYAAEIIRLTEGMPNTRAANHVGGQLLRSGTSPLLNHGEAQAAESRNDFVHKMKICQKGLRESERALRLVKRVPLVSSAGDVDSPLKETDELIRIFVASLHAAEKNKVREGAVEDYGANDEL